jgi:hypothetical protein
MENLFSRQIENPSLIGVFENTIRRWEQDAL